MAELTTGAISKARSEQGHGSMHSVSRTIEIFLQFTSRLVAAYDMLQDRTLLVCALLSSGVFELRKKKNSNGLAEARDEFMVEASEER